MNNNNNAQGARRNSQGVRLSCLPALPFRRAQIRRYQSAPKSEIKVKTQIPSPIPAVASETPGPK